MTSKTRSGRRRGRSGWRWLYLGVGLVAAGTAGWAAYQEASGRTSPPVYTRMAAERALTELRRAHGDRWAPEPSRRAETALRDALFECRRQELTFFLLRNYEQAGRDLRRAEGQIRDALVAAQRECSQKRATAQRALAQADQVVGRTDRVAAAVNLGQYDRIMLQRARLAVREAKILFEHAEYADAARRADLAVVQAVRVTGNAADAVARFADPATVRSWKKMIDDTVAWSRSTGAPAIVVSKESHALTLYDDGRPVRTYRVELGSNSIRDKIFAGDNATPEGRYRITAKKGVGNSTYHRALLLNYPNDEDRVQFARMRQRGQLARNASLGGLIELHGEGGRGKDWTKGCVALKNRDMDDLFPRVGVGTPVTIVGGDGNGGEFTDLVRNHRNGNGQNGGTRTD